jgi:hypothetical protein
VRALWNFYRRNMAEFEDDRKDRYPKTYRNHVLKTIPLVHRFARELATLYVRAPSRDYSRAGQPLSDPVAALVATMAEEVKLDRQFRSAQEQMVVMGSATLWCWPSTKSGRLRLICPPLHDQAVELVDAIGSDEEDVAAWWIRLPVGHDNLTGLVTYATAKITPTTATWESGPEDLMAGARGVWTDDGSNPLGMIPAVRVRISDPAPGEFFATAPEDLLQAQIAICHDHTSMGLIAELQGHGQAVIRGMSMGIDQLEVGPETIVGLPDPQADFQIVAANANLEGYKAISEHYTRSVIATNGLNPATLMRSQGLTALAKRIELVDREVERLRHVSELTRAEVAIHRILARWTNWMRGSELIPDDLDVAVSYREPAMPADPLHEAQKIEREVAMNLTSPARELARLEGIGLDQARQQIKINAADNSPDATRIDDDTAPPPLNLAGIQLSAAVNIATLVGSGQITEGGGVALLQEGLGLSEYAARLLVKDAKAPAVPE